LDFSLALIPYLLFIVLYGIDQPEPDISLFRSHLLDRHPHPEKTKVNLPIFLLAVIGLRRLIHCLILPVCQSRDEFKR